MRQSGRHLSPALAERAGEKKVSVPIYRRDNFGMIAVCGTPIVHLLSNVSILGTRKCRVKRGHVSRRLDTMDSSVQCFRASLPRLKQVYGLSLSDRVVFASYSPTSLSIAS